MLRSGYTFSNSARDIRLMAESDPGYAALLEKARTTAEQAYAAFADDVSRLSGWGHNFCCPHCASQLVFDPAMPFPPQKPFRCPHCGAQATGKELDEAWVYYHRYHYGAALSSVALMALLGDEKCLSFLIHYLDFYAERYHAFPVHGEHAGKGKVMGQSLDEAVWGIQLLRAMKIAEPLLPASGKQVWLEKLFRPMAALLSPQSMRIHNIPTWQRAFIGMVGLYYADDALLADAMEGPFGLRRQIACGFTEDGLWREGSLTYHYYTVEALTNFFSFYALKAPDDPLFDTFERMFAAPLALSHDGYALPALNDGWYPQRVNPLVLRAARLSADPAITEQLAMLRRRHPAALNTPDALLYALPPKAMTLYQHTNLAIFHTPVFAILKSGVLEGSHMHRDYLSLSMPPFSDDLGTPGYGHPLTPAWYKLAAAHNTVTVDGALPEAVLPTHIEALPDGACAVIDGGLPGISRAMRRVTAGGGALHDTLLLEGDTAHTYDWFFHAVGDAQFEGSLSPAGALGEESGYQFLTDVRRVAPCSAFTAAFTHGGRTLTVHIPDTTGIEIYVARSPGNPADMLRHTLILRQSGLSAVFQARYSVN